MAYLLKKGSGIHIKKSHKGRFTEYCGGNVTEECIRRGKNSADPKIQKQAVFAQNARKFKHQDGGSLYGASQIQTNSNLAQQWKQQQDMAMQNFNQSLEQKKQFDEIKRMQAAQKAQALGQSLGSTVGQLVGTGMQTMVQNIKERKQQENNVGIINEDQEQENNVGVTNSNQGTTTQQQWQPSFASLQFQPMPTWPLYGKTASMKDGGNFGNIINTNKLFSTYESVEPSRIKEKETEMPDFKSRYDYFLEKLNKYKTTEKEASELLSETENWFSDTTNEPMTNTSQEKTIDYTTKDLQTMLNEQGLDKYIIITSGYRDHNIGKAGSKSNHRKKNQHGHSLAYDIVPARGETFDSIYQKIKQNPAMQQWLSQNGFNINDETDAATLRRTGGTGAHFHIGPDKFNIRKAHSGLDFKNLLSYYQSVDLDNDNNTNKIKISSKPKKPDTIFSLYTPNESTTTKVDDESNDDREWFIEIPQMSQEKPKREFTSYAGYNKFNRDFDTYGTDEIFKKHKNFWSYLAATESSFNPTAQNSLGAYGYFQLMPQSCSGKDIQTQFNDAAKLMKSYMGILSQTLTEDDIKKAKQKGITEEGLMAGVWLGGPGHVKEALRNKGNAKDLNKTSVMNYMIKFSTTK